MDLDAPHLTLLFLATVLALAMALVWLFCELERRFGKRLTSAALARFGHRNARHERRTNRHDS